MTVKIKNTGKDSVSYNLLYFEDKISEAAESIVSKNMEAKLAEKQYISNARTDVI